MKKNGLPVTLLSLSTPNSRVGDGFDDLLRIPIAIKVYVPNAREVGVRMSDASISGEPGCLVNRGVSV